jgi:hypothetical protein
MLIWTTGPQLLQTLLRAAVMFPDGPYLFTAEIRAFGAGRVSFLKRALPDGADQAITEYFFLVRLPAAKAVDCFPVYVRFKHGGPFTGRLFSQVIIILYGGLVGIAVRADKPAFGDNHGIHTKLL